MSRRTAGLFLGLMLIILIVVIGSLLEPLLLSSVIGAALLSILIASGSIVPSLVVGLHEGMGFENSTTHEWRYSFGRRHSGATIKEAYDHDHGAGAYAKVGVKIGRVAFWASIACFVTAVVLPNWYLIHSGGIGAVTIVVSSVASLLGALTTIAITYFVGITIPRIWVLVVWGLLLAAATRLTLVERFWAWARP